MNKIYTTHLMLTIREFFKNIMSHNISQIDKLTNDLQFFEDHNVAKAYRATVLGFKDVSDGEIMKSLIKENKKHFTKPPPIKHAQSQKTKTHPVFSSHNAEDFPPLPKTSNKMSKTVSDSNKTSTIEISPSSPSYPLNAGIQKPQLSSINTQANNFGNRPNENGQLVRIYALVRPLPKENKPNLSPQLLQTSVTTFESVASHADIFHRHHTASLMLQHQIYTQITTSHSVTPVHTTTTVNTTAPLQSHKFKSVREMYTGIPRPIVPPTSSKGVDMNIFTPLLQSTPNTIIDSQPNKTKVQDLDYESGKFACRRDFLRSA